MRKVIEKVRSNTVLSVSGVLVMGIFVLFIASKLGTLVTSEIENYLVLNFYTKNIVMKFLC